MLVVGDSPAARARAVAEAVIAAMAQPFPAPMGTAHVGASVGIVLAPTHATSTSELRHCGDVALYQAKSSGRGTICFYHPSMDAAARDRRALELDLRAAMERGEITLLYQPVLRVDTGAMASAEALARWTHPTRGPIRPDLFIAIAEESGLIVPLGRMLLRQACIDAATWPEHLGVAVNLSPVQFHAGDVYDTVIAALADSGLPPHRLKLEVTENVVMHDVERTFVELERLRAAGIKILMDDFGTGYSSLSYFERFPFDKVKIDQSFVRGLDTSRAAGAIIKAIVGLGEALGMAIVAEGVETCAQRDALVLAGCTHLQGYLFSRPVSSASIAALGAAGPDARALAA
ncbi:putative signal transduction protein with EAL and GGDEF domain [Sphingomonas sp. BK580]|nr:putative signal transduction protein with EAL and GGDEF domain [Sphingomonas sp. BK580]